MICIEHHGRTWYNIVLKWRFHSGYIQDYSGIFKSFCHKFRRSLFQRLCHRLPMQVTGVDPINECSFQRFDICPQIVVDSWQHEHIHGDFGRNSVCTNIIADQILRKAKVRLQIWRKILSYNILFSQNIIPVDRTYPDLHPLAPLKYKGAEWCNMMLHASKIPCMFLPTIFSAGHCHGILANGLLPSCGPMSKRGYCSWHYHINSEQQHFRHSALQYHSKSLKSSSSWITSFLHTGKGFQWLGSLYLLDPLGAP